MAKKDMKKFKINESLRLAVYGVLALIASYGFISWAIDSGSIWHYIFAFASLYYAIHFIKEAVKKRFFVHDKGKKARRARS